MDLYGSFRNWDQIELQRRHRFHQLSLGMIVCPLKFAFYNLNYFKQLNTIHIYLSWGLLNIRELDKILKQLCQSKNILKHLINIDHGKHFINSVQHNSQQSKSIFIDNNNTKMQESTTSNSPVSPSQPLISKFTSNLERFLQSNNHKCQAHNKIFNLLCIDEKCEHRGLICSTCLTINGNHKNHDAQQLVQYITNYMKSINVNNNNKSNSNDNNFVKDQVWDLINRAGIVYDQILVVVADFVENCNKIIQNYVAARTKLHQEQISKMSNNSTFNKIIECEFASLSEANRLLLSLSSPVSLRSNFNSQNKSYEKAQAYLEDIMYQHNFIGRELKKLQAKVNEMLVVKSFSPVVLHFQPSFERPGLLQSPEYTYIGEIKQNRPWGKGTLYSKSGNKMIAGTFINGKVEGQAELYYETGDYYLGEFRNDRKEGRGAHRWNNQQQSNLYQGQFKNGRRHGRGTFWWADGSKYIGNFLEGNQTGYGQLYREKQILEYDGYWLKGQFHGKGVQYFPNGQIYQGEFKQDKFNGEGILRKRDETIYGVWVNNQLKIVHKTEKN